MAGLSKVHQEGIQKHTDKIIELCATDVAKIDDGEIIPTLASIRETFIAIRNNAILIEDFVEKARETYR